MSDKFQFNNYFRISNKENYSITIGEFNSQPSLSIWNSKDGSKKPKISFLLTRDICIWFSKIIAKLKDAAPNTDFSFIKSSFNPETNKFDKLVFIANFIKDDKNIFHIGFSGGELKTEVRFMFTSPGGIALGSENVSISERSKIGLEVFADFIKEETRLMRTLSRLNYVAPVFNNNARPASNTGNSTVPAEDSGMFG